MKQSDGSTATVTLNRVRYAANDTFDLAIVDLTISNTGTHRFSYSEDQVSFAYPDSDQSWEHNDDDNTWGPSPIEDFTPFTPPSPLRVGDLQPAKSVRGLVILELGADPKTHYLLIFTDPATGQDLAEWRLVSR